MNEALAPLKESAMQYKVSFLAILVLMVFVRCTEEEHLMSDFTGNEVSYTLNAGSDWDLQGSARFLEKMDGTAQIIIEVKGLEGDKRFPVHLHYDAYHNEADLAAQLEPLSAANGTSVTNLSQLANEAAISYRELLSFDGHIKVHLADAGPLKDIILSYGNIGKNTPLPLDMKVAKCYGY